MLGAILKKVSGEILEDYLKPRLFDKLEISDFDWELSPQGLNTAGYGLRVSTDSIARFGQFYIQKGKWEGEQLLPESWIEEATMKQTDSQEGDSDWSQGYGYQFWRCKPEPGFFRGDGAYGQYCIMIPQYDMVLAVNSESFDMGKSMQIMWDHILPGIKPENLPEDKKTQKALTDLCAGLQLPVPEKKRESARLPEINNIRYEISANPYGVKAMTFDVGSEKGVVKIETADGTNMLDFGIQNWVVNDEFTDNNFPLENRIHVPSLVAATATWVDDSTLQINRKFIEAIHGDILTCKFDDNTLSVSFNNSVSEHAGDSSDSRSPVTGKA